jgi:CheY-like chemotaxis protein
VSDTGPGIPREQVASIFDHFYQLDGSYENKKKGFGIGLALAKEFIALHHGEIQVNSEEGRGAEFVVRLPTGKDHLEPGMIVDLSEPAPPPGGQPAIAVNSVSRLELERQESEPPENSKKETQPHEQPGKDILLLVEDSVDMRQYIKNALEPDYQVEEAVNGREGIKKAHEIIPDLIISDIMMPGVDGYKLCRELKNHRDTSHVPIILLTAKAAEENIIKGLETGADDYITKPFNTTILCARVKNLINLRSHLQQTIDREMRLQPAKMLVSAVDKEFMAELKAVIDKNLSEPGFNVEELSKQLYMSHTTLYRKIQALTGESPRNFIRTYRLKRGAELLKTKSGNVGDVAFNVGFTSTSYFIKCFKEKFHQLPSRYKVSD